MNQITLDLGLPTSYRAADFFVSDSNRLAYDYVVRWPHWDSPNLWIYGPSACGKTHLAHIIAERANARMLNALPSEPSEALFAEHDMLILDDIWDDYSEETLFHLLNHAKSMNKSVIFTHENPPSHVTFDLPDLQSRLRSVTAIGINQPDDMVLQAVMMKQLADRQLKVSPDVISYAIKRIDRSTEAVHQLVNKIDQASLEQGRTVTLPFVKGLFTEM
ncbi:MAG: DnaA/Hda family protein [Rickettsiales bacterium]|nr:DnaA/Hda family protein [Rickettsiales bacterium]